MAIFCANFVSFFKTVFIELHKKLEFSINFIEIALRHGCSTVNLLYIFRIPFPTNTSGWLLQLMPHKNVIEQCEINKYLKFEIIKRLLSA